MLSPKTWREELGHTRERMDEFLGLPAHAGGPTWADYETAEASPPVDLVARCEAESGGRVTAASWVALMASGPISPRAWRRELGLSRREMGIHIGIPHRAADTLWGNYERGLSVPSIDILARCEAMSAGRVTAASWLAVTMALPKIPPGRLYGTRLQSRMADAAAA